QNGDTITEAITEGKIYVVDFFFTTCPNLCPRMTEQFYRVQEQFKNDAEILLLSHSVFPNHDTVEVLAKYARENRIDSEKWHLLTGEKKQIYELARKSYFAVTTSGDGGKEDFIHTENFVLVDKEKRLRGFYDGTSKEEVNQLMFDIRKLKAEYVKD
ncbi:MAG: protein SCO1/2, partial [Flavobacteriales bacterium]